MHIIWKGLQPACHFGGFLFFFSFFFHPLCLCLSDTEGCGNKGDPHWPLSALCSSKDGVCLHHHPHPHDTNPGEITPNKEECGKKRQRGVRGRSEMSLQLRGKKSERVTKTGPRYFPRVHIIFWTSRTVPRKQHKRRLSRRASSHRSD